MFHPVTRRRGDVITTSLYKSQWRGRYVSDKTPNDIWVEHRQDVSVVRHHNVLLECRDYVLRECNNGVPSVRIHDALNKSETTKWSNQRHLSGTYPRRPVSTSLRFLM